MLGDTELFDAMSAIHHKQEATLFDLMIGDVQFPDSKGIAVHSFSFLFVQEEHMHMMHSDKPEQDPFAVMIS